MQPLFVMPMQYYLDIYLRNKYNNSQQGGSHGDNRYGDLHNCDIGIVFIGIGSIVLRVLGLKRSCKKGEFNQW